MLLLKQVFFKFLQVKNDHHVHPHADRKSKGGQIGVGMPMRSLELRDVLNCSLFNLLVLLAWFIETMGMVATCVFIVDLRGHVQRCQGSCNKDG